MDLSTIDPAVIEARGKYATVNGEYKTLMSTMQSYTQQAWDLLRHGLQESNAESAATAFAEAAKLSAKLKDMVEVQRELKAQKDELYQAAWGKS